MSAIKNSNYKIFLVDVIKAMFLLDKNTDSLFNSNRRGV